MLNLLLNPIEKKQYYNQIKFYHPWIKILQLPLINILPIVRNNVSFYEHSYLPIPVASEISKTRWQNRGCKVQRDVHPFRQLTELKWI